MAVSQCPNPTRWIVNNERAAWRDESPKSDVMSAVMSASSRTKQTSPSSRKNATLFRQKRGMPMKAAFIERHGGPEVLEYGDMPDPCAAAGEVAVDIVAASVNGADWK